jgi:subtilisin family serine protease
MPVLDFGAGHGTFAAGIVRQVDPEARIMVYRALDTRGLGSEEAVADAMIRAADDGAHVISLSLGMEAENDDNLPFHFMRAAVNQILARPNPPAIVAAAGNNGDEERVYPAALDGVISVAALQAVEDPNHPHSGPPPDGAEWSSHGDWVRCSAVGEGIVSTFVKGAEDERFGTDVYPMNGEGESWAVWSGTSFAAPQIAALIATACRDLSLSTQAPVNPRAVADDLFPPGNPAADGYGQRVVLLPGTRPTP